MKKWLTPLALLFALFASQADAQWQVPSNEIPIGRGGGVTGFGSTYTPGHTGARARSVRSKIDEFVSVSDFTGADCSGSTSSSTAFAAAHAASNRILVPQKVGGTTCTWKLSTNQTWPNGKVWNIQGPLSVDTGITITNRGVVQAGAYQIFSGLGTVTGIKWVMPEWWGAAGTGTSNDDAGAIQKAQNSIEASATSDGVDPCLCFQQRQYGVGSTITATPGATYHVRWLGQGGSGTAGTKFVGLASFTGTAVLKVAGAAANATTSQFKFEGFSIAPQTAGSGPTVGILVGGSGSSLILQGGVHKSPFIDIQVSDFASNWTIQDARLIQFVRSSGWCTTLASCVALTISNSASATSFTGDMDFDAGSQFVATSSSSAACSITSNTGSAQVAGIRIASALYTGPCNITATGGYIHDIWFTPGFQFDGISAAGFVIGVNGGTVANIFLDGGYIYGNSSTATSLINVFKITGTLEGIRIKGNILAGQLGGAAASSVSINGARSSFIQDNHLRGLGYPGNALIALLDCNGCVASGNVASQFGTSEVFRYLVSIASSDYYVIRNNLSNGVATNGTALNSNILNTAAGTHAVIDGNW